MCHVVSFEKTSKPIPKNSVGFFWDTKHMVQFNAFEFFGSFRFTMQQCELDIDNFLSGGSNFPHKKSFIKLPLAAQQHLEGNGKMLKWTEGGNISCSLQCHFLKDSDIGERGGFIRGCP